MKTAHVLALGALIGLPAITSAGTFMDADWAKQACEKWNQTPALTNELAGEVWMDNNAGRGYKVLHLYRTHCGENTKQQLTISAKDGKAICTYGGAPTEKNFSPKSDYLMHATDEHWACMGKGDFGCGPMGAMMSGKLKFTGPKMEAMGVMGPFESFLRLTGTVAGDTSSCPSAQ